MINELVIWDKFYQNVIPEEHWNYNMQKEFAKEATAFYVLFNELKVIDLDKIVEPYVFTKKAIANELEKLLGYHVGDFELSPNCNGGMLAIYIGSEDSLILTVELEKDYTLIIDYMQKGVMSKATYSYEVGSDYKAKEIERLLTRLFYEWF